MISSRQKEILKFIVEEYIKSARPVSSNSICNYLNCSSATIRNEMVILEDLGYLEKNHFASGRTPSELGYRYYVENLMKPKDLTGEDMLKLQTIFSNNSLELSDTIKRSIELISELTNYTAVVLGNNSKDNRLKKVEVIPLNAERVVMMLITDKGHVEYKNMNIGSGVSSEELTKTVELINKLLVDTPIDEINEKLEYEIKPVISRYVKQYTTLYNAFYDAFSEFTSKASDVHFIGRSNMLKQPEFNNIDKVKHLLSKFDDASLINEMSEDKNGINIYIGTENELSDDVSVIKTRYNYNGEEGTIAIVGPKRMEYDRVITLLNYINDNLNNS